MAKNLHFLPFSSIIDYDNCAAAKNAARPLSRLLTGYGSPAGFLALAN